MLNIPHVDRRSFAKHFITGAHLEIRFPQRKLDWPIFEKAIRESLKKLGFPALKRQIKSQLQFQADKSQSGKFNILQSGPGITDALIATSAEGNFAIQFRNDRVVFSNQTYRSFDEMLKSVITIFTEASRIMEIESINWLGIRKINELLAARDDGPGYIGEGVNDQFFSPIKSNFLPAEFLLEANNRYVLKRDGFKNIIEVSATKQTSNAYVVRIDLDVNKDSLSISKDDLEGLSSMLKSMNDTLFDIFCWIVSPDLIKVLETR